MNYFKSYLNKKQVSIDGGLSWNDVEPEIYSVDGKPIATYDNLLECECSGNTKIYWINSSGETYSLECNGSNILTRREVLPLSGASKWLTMTEATIGCCVSTIGDEAFMINTSKPMLTKVDFPSSVTSIGSRAFQDNYNLSNINSVYSKTADLHYVKSFGDYIFQINKSIENIILGESGITFGEGVFAHCTSLKKINLPSDMTTIPINMLVGCLSLTNITIPNSVTTIGNGAFQGCISLESVIIPSNVTSIGNYVFGGCSSLTSITIPNSVTTISTGMLSACSSLTSVTIPNSVTSIVTQAFRECTSLESIDIPSSVTTIGDDAFEGCTSLTNVTVEATTPPTVDSDSFRNTNNCPIYVPDESVNAYKTATNWSGYADRIKPISEKP